MYDHSVRVPFIAAGPGVAEATSNETPIYLQDVMPTTLELAGVDKPDHVQFHSLMPLVRGERTVHAYDAIYGAYLQLQRMVTLDGFKLIAYPRAKRLRLYNLRNDGSYPADNTGLYDMTGQRRDMGRFKAPSLRNVAVTAPYMHDGSIANLRDVIAHYARGGRLIESGPNAGDGRLNPFKSEFVRGFELRDEERDSLVAFLESLTDQNVLTDPRFSNPFVD